MTAMKTIAFCVTHSSYDSFRHTHQILCHLHRVDIVRVELERDGLRAVLHLALDDVVFEAQHLQLRIALGRAVVSTFLRAFVRQPLGDGGLRRGWYAGSGRCRWINWRD